MINKTRCISILLISLAALAIHVQRLSAQPNVARKFTLSRLKVSDNQRYLVDLNNQPFFWLGDTAWELFHRLNREEAELYLRHRSEQGFTVIQSVVLAEIDGLDVPNAYGHLPLVDKDPTRPNEQYFQHVDWVVEKANSLGLRIGLLPTWGSYWHSKKVIFDPQNAEDYGKYLGNRYRHAGVIWILGGDRLVESARHREILESMADGLAQGDGGNHLMTFHPRGGRSSSESFHEASWLSFNMQQSGHSPLSTNYSVIEQDYAKTPIRPCLDGEPAYEYPPDAMPFRRPVGSTQVRRNAYWSVFAGAFGHTYGTHPIWQMYAPGRKPLWDVTTPWNESLNLPGASQMVHLKNLMLSRPFLTRIPDQKLVVSGQADGIGRVQATRDGSHNANDATYAFIYIPDDRQIIINAQSFAASEICAWWFDPSDGTSSEIGVFNKNSLLSFKTPQRTSGNDWVLVLDAVSANYPKP